MCRGYVYSPPDDVVVDPMLNGYCVETSCYDNVVSNSTFTSDQCDRSFCKVAKTLIPTVPDDNQHWFFDYFLYIGGTIHLMMSIAMLVSYLLINKANFVLPDFVRWYVKTLENDRSTSTQKVIMQKAKQTPVLGTLVKRTSTYSDEPLIGTRLLYHIVSVEQSHY